MVYNFFTKDVKNSILNNKNKILVEKNSEVHVIDYTVDQSKFKFINNVYENIILEENAKLKNEGYYKNNQRKGFWKYYYDNGNIKKKVNYRYGKLRGYFRSYYNNGQLESEGNFIDIEEKDGLWTFYDEDGELQEQHLYKDKILILKKMYDNSDSNSDVKILGKYTPLSRPMKWGK